MFKFIWRILILISTSYGIYGGVYMAADQPNLGFLLYYTTQSNLWCCLFFLYLMMTDRKRPWIKGGITAAIIVTFISINVQNYFQLIPSYKIPMQKEKTLTQILV